MRFLVAPSIFVLLPALAGAFPVDEARRFNLRARLYTEASIATENSEPQTTPSRAMGQLVSHRSFFNPELDGDLTTLQPMGLDALKFRLALWASMTASTTTAPASTRVRRIRSRPASPRATHRGPRSRERTV